MTETLVLSSAYEPMDQVGWQRAMVLWMTGRVEVVEAYDDWICNTSTTAYRVPAVVRFVNALRRRRKSVRFSRENVFLRDRGRCQYCGKRLPLSQATYDHVVPRAQGGATTWTNVVISCVPCNQKKRDRTPIQAKMRLLATPRRPKHLRGMRADVLQYRDHMPPVWEPYLGN